MIVLCVKSVRFSSRDKQRVNEPPKRELKRLQRERQSVSAAEGGGVWTVMTEDLTAGKHLAINLQRCTHAHTHAYTHTYTITYANSVLALPKFT